MKKGNYLTGEFCFKNIIFEKEDENPEMFGGQLAIMKA